MKKTLFFLSVLLFSLASCSNENSLIGTWNGKNYDGLNVKWTFQADGSASSTKSGGAVQEMKYVTDDTKTPKELNLNSLVDEGTLRAIYKFTEKGKLVIGINQDVTIRPEGFAIPGLQMLILTKE